MNKLPKITLVFNRRNVESATRKAAVEYEISLKGKRKYISSGILLHKNEWKNGRIVNNRDLLTLNNILDNTISRMWKKVEELQGFGIPITIDEIVSVFKEEDENTSSFIEYMRYRILNRTDLSEGTLKHHRVTLLKLEEFKHIKYWKDLTVFNIREFDDWLRNSGLSQSSIWGQHKTVKAYIKEGIANDWITKSPYELFKVDKGNTSEIRYLTEDELLAIRKLEINGYLKHARDMFVLQCFTGQAFSDFVKTDFSRVRDNNYVLRDERTKSGVAYRIKLMKPAREILDEYDWSFPMMSMQKYNAYLKAIQLSCHIETNLTSHVARHTFAVMMINNGIPVEYVSKMLGHKNVKTTQIYAEILGKTIDNVFDEIDDKFSI